jgi:carbonic anhydrase
MPASSFLSRLTWQHCLPVLMLACSGPVWAADPASPLRPIAAPDPMDVVRERLAQRLGVIRPAADNNVVRVVSKPSTDAPEAAALKEPAAKATAQRAAAKPRERVAPAHAELPSAEHWDYSGAGGPQDWGRMNPEFAKCSSGTRQSPIDIRDGIKVELDPVQFDYKPSAFKVIDNGHTVQVNVANGNWIDVMGQRYQLVQFHFHRPSEERIDGKPFDMVVHLVHKSLEGRLAVVAVLLERGSAQPVVQSVWNNLPLEKGDEVPARAPIDMNQLLPAERGYFTYMGSLTTPPCSEGVLWMVMKQPVSVSPEQIGIFARLYPMNARPIQSVSGRLIKESN